MLYLVVQKFTLTNEAAFAMIDGVAWADAHSRMVGRLREAKRGLTEVQYNREYGRTVEMMRLFHRSCCVLRRVRSAAGAGGLFFYCPCLTQQ